MPKKAKTMPDDAEYGAEAIQVLGGREAIRRRPGMYIGSTDQRGLHHLVYEIVYNSVDEAMAGRCTRINIFVMADGSVRVEDDGGGIPVETHPVTKKSALETVMTTLHAGAKFGGRVYQVSGGLHGVGASVVNALSAWCQVDVKRDGKVYRQEYKQGIPQGEVTGIGKGNGTGTTTTFIADEEIFGTARYDFNTLRDRIREMAYLNKGLEIYFNDERIDRELTFYFEGGINSFVRYLNRGRTTRHRPPVYISKTANGTIVESSIQYNDGFTESIHSFANCVNTVDGGTHLTGFRSALTRALNDYSRKNKFLKDDDPNLTGEDVREGLTAVISVKLGEPQFEGQTKGKLGNPEVKGTVESVIGEGLSLYFEEHPDDIKKIIEKCLLSAKAREAARKARDLIVKKSSFDTGTLPGKLAECSEKEPSLCEIFLVEGDSAGGSAKQGRERRFQAILPLWGKILNVEKAPADKIFSHEAIRAVITALGAGIDEEMDLSRLRYHKVILMADADVDGSHIRTLLLTFFFRYMLKLINNGHLFIAQPPLYRVTIGKAKEWAYSDDDRDRIIRAKSFSSILVQSKDKALTMTGAEIADLIDPLKQISNEIDKLEKAGWPRQFTEILLQKDKEFHRLDFSKREDLEKVRNWVETLHTGTVRSSVNSRSGELWLEIDFEGKKATFDKDIFENPILHRCFNVYPQVKRIAAKKKYIVFKKNKEIGTDIPWTQLSSLLEKISEKSGVSLQRYKGLGEMNNEQLWETTMNPDTRTLLQVNIDDAAKADQIFRTLMGEEVPPRKAFIQAHAKSVKNLDI